MNPSLFYIKEVLPVANLQENIIGYFYGVDSFRDIDKAKRWTNFLIKRGKVIRDDKGARQHIIRLEGEREITDWFILPISVLLGSKAKWRTFVYSKGNFLIEDSFKPSIFHQYLIKRWNRYEEDYVEGLEEEERAK